MAVSMSIRAVLPCALDALKLPTLQGVDFQGLELSASDFYGRIVIAWCDALGIATPGLRFCPFNVPNGTETPPRGACGRVCMGLLSGLRALGCMAVPVR